MISILALRAALMAALMGVQGLAVVSEGDRTRVLIDVDGQVTYEHDRIANPPRIVVDILGAEFRLSQQQFLDIDRGGVLALRSSQYQRGVVRVVIDLAVDVDYTVERAGGTIVVSFVNPEGPFDAWRSAAAPAMPGATPAFGEPAPLGAALADPRPADRRGAAVPVSTPTAPVIQAAPQPEQPPIWVEFRNTPITDVLATFADFSGRSIVPGQGVQDQLITASIQGQPWDEAMRAILAGQGLTGRELPSGIIMVTSLEQQRRTEAQEPMISRAFPLQYAAADSALRSLREYLAGAAEGEQVGRISAFRETNTLMVRARQSVIDEIESLMPSIDRPMAQVTVSARIITINRSRIRELGFRYEFLDHRAGATRVGDEPTVGLPPNVSLAGNTVAAIGNAAVEPLTDATFSAIMTLVLSQHRLITWVDAAQSVGLAELQADPTVSVTDNHTARIQVGQRVPIRVIDPGAAGQQGPQAQVREENVGVILEIRPSVVGDQVRLELHIERSFIEPAPLAGQFVFRTSETTTSITVDDGQTAVISGLTTADLRRNQSGIPILMNLPLIGALFRHQAVEEEVEDILIMVTPHIER